MEGGMTTPMIVCLERLRRQSSPQLRLFDLAQRPSKLSTVSHTLSNTSLFGDHGSITASGVRKRKSEPCANSMKIAGHRETSGSLRPRQNS
jgi:hypothetical protein